MTVEEAIALVEHVIEQGQLNKVQALVLREAWQGKSYLEIAVAAGYDPGYIKDTGSKLWQRLSEVYGVKITKLNFQRVLKQIAYQTPAKLPANQWVKPRADWGEAIDVSIFYGRRQELTRLQTWIVQDRCRLVTLLGMGGMGKTSLSVKLAEEVQSEFTSLIWRSLRDAPPIDELLPTLIQALSQQQDAELPTSVGGKLSRLIELLKQFRCLIVLDNFETVLQSGKRAGIYRDGYEMYGELLKRVGEIAHQSCLVLTSREKPQEVGMMEGERMPVRTLPLAGLDLAAAQYILAAKGLQGAVEDREQLIAHYRGNPLALKMAATSIQDLFAGDIAQFLQQGTVAFSSIGNLLQQQCHRLSAFEQTVMN